MRKFGKILVALVLMLGLGLLVGCSCEKEKEKVLEGITVTPASLTLESSEMQVLEVKPVPADVELPSVEFTSSDSRIASVGKDGKVMGLRAGTAEITVKVGEFTKKVTVTVNPVMPTALTLSKTEVTLKVGEKVAITYKVEPQDTTDQVAAFASDNEAIATVSAEGEITAVAEGETVVTVSLGGLEEEVAVTVNPADVLPASVRIKPLESNDLVVGETLQLEGFILPADAVQDAFVWASSDEAVATVSAEGLVTALAAGEVEISLSLKNYPNVPAAKVTLNCYVPLPERLRVNGPDKIVVIEGELYEFTVSFEPDGTYTDVTWSVDDETKATIDPETGKVTALAPGPLTITATSTALAALKASKMIIVEAYVAPEVIVEGKVSLGIGLVSNYKATVKGNYLGPNVTWSVSDEAVLSIDEAGNVTGLAAGTANVIAASVDDPEVKGMLEVTVIDVGENKNVLIKAGVEDDGGTTVYDGVTYYNGINALPDLTGVDLLLKDGSKIFVLAGEYASNPIEIKAKNVSLIGPNAGISAVDGVRVEEAILSGKITLTGADNFTIDGLTLTGKSPIRSTSGLRTLTIKNNNFNEVASEGAGAEGVVFLFAGADAIEYHDVLVQGNIFKDRADGPGFRGLRLDNIMNLSVLDNKFDGFYDAIKLSGTNDRGLWGMGNPTIATGIGLGGEALIKGNQLVNGIQYTILLGHITATKLDILHNTIIPKTDAAYGNGTILMNHVEVTEGDPKRIFNIKYNDFAFPSKFHGLRLDGCECTADVLEINVEWNKWLNEPPAEGRLYVVSRFYEGMEPTDPAKYPVYVANNCYKALPTDAMFSKVRRDAATAWTNEAAFDYARGVESGEISPVDITIEGPDTIIGLNVPTQYTANVPANDYGTDVIWSVSDEEIISVDQTGKVTGLAAGSANVIVTLAANPGISAAKAIVVVDTDMLLVDPNIPAEQESAVYNGITYLKGHNLFTNITDALVAVKDGTVINAAPADYPEIEVTISAKNVSVYGPNAGISAVDGTRRPEANLSGKIILDGADNFLIDGFHMVSKASISSTTGLNKLTIKNNNFESVTAAMAVIYLTAATENIEYHDVELEGNLMSETSVSGPGWRGFRAHNVVNLRILNNKFIGFYEPIRVEATNGVGKWGAAGGASTAGVGAGLGGEVLIQGNITENVGEYPLYFGRVTADKVDILNNTIRLNAQSDYSYGTMMFTNIVLPADGVKRIYNIKYNDLMFSGGWHGLRIDSSGCTKDTLEINVEWNKWLTEHNFYPDTPDEDGQGNFHEDYVISRFYDGKTPSDPEQYPIWVANNFYQSKPEDYMFTNIRRNKEAYWLDEALFDAARLAAQG
ncbi:MAG: Ig-like domain-containing protein [Bacilli bacterium]|jgi:uncharacterized protein YjdB